MNSTNDKTSGDPAGDGLTASATADATSDISSSPAEAASDTSDDVDMGMLQMSDDISDIRLIDIPVFIVFWVLLVIVFLQFFTRYVLNDSLSWTEEIARYFLILLGFVGSVTCVRKGSHIFLEFFYRYLPDRAIKPLSMAVEFFSAVFFGYLGYLAIGFMEKTKAQKMVSIDLPKSIIYLIVVLSCFAMMIAGLVNVYRMYRERADDVARKKIDQALSV